MKRLYFPKIKMTTIVHQIGEDNYKTASVFTNNPNIANEGGEHFQSIVSPAYVVTEDGFPGQACTKIIKAKENAEDDWRIGATDITFVDIPDEQVIPEAHRPNNTWGNQLGYKVERETSYIDIRHTPPQVGIYHLPGVLDSHLVDIRTVADTIEALEDETLIKESLFTNSTFWAFVNFYMKRAPLFWTKVFMNIELNNDQYEPWLGRDVPGELLVKKYPHTTPAKTHKELNSRIKDVYSRLYIDGLMRGCVLMKNKKPGQNATREAKYNKRIHSC